MNQIGTLTQEEIINLGFEYERDWGWYKKYTVEIYTETKSFFRRIAHIELQHTETYHTGTLMSVIRILVNDSVTADLNEVLYEGECLNLEELIWIITKTTKIQIIEGKMVGR
jgi:hypothetical protein